MKRHDAIVIGAGVNGLTAAAYLARGGFRVLVLDRNARAGGSDMSHEIAPGFRLARFTLGHMGLPAKIVTDLDLARHGLRFLRTEGGVTLTPQGTYLASYRDGIVQRREIARHSAHDADAFTRYRRDRLADAHRLAPLLTKQMDDLVGRNFGAFRRRLALARKLATMAPDEMIEASRIWTRSMAQTLDDYFENDLIKAHLAGPALMGATLGPCSQTSASRLVTGFLGLHGSAACDAGAGLPDHVMPLGGPDAMMDALRGAIEAKGGSLRLEAEVTDVMIRNARVRGVVLADGEEIEADAVLSDLDLKRSFLSLFHWKDLPDGLVTKAGGFRTTGVVAKINLALDGLPAFPALPQDAASLAGGLLLASSIGEMDRAYDDWRDALPPREPIIQAFLPSLTDTTLAPQGKHVMSVMVQFVPQMLYEGAWTASRRAELTKHVMARIAAVSPGFEKRVIASELLLPGDMENEAGVTSGDLAQGEMTLDQMFVNRPFAAGGSYETPLRNFYICSSSAHPGTLAAGMAGANAAARILVAGRKRAAS